jgi:protoporphyrinogen oxidase
VNSRDELCDCVVVGGGLSGLAAAFRLVTSGRSVTVLEAGPDVGGRARSRDVSGIPADLGFQSIFTAYPEAAAFLRAIGMRQRDLVSFSRGAVLHDGLGWEQMQMGPRALHRFGPFTNGDVLRLGRLAAEVRASTCTSLLAGDAQDETMEDHLRRRGFSGKAIEGFFRPLFGVITLDRGLQTDAGYFRFLMRMLVEGSAAIPVEGHGMIARWAAAAIRQRGGRVETSAAVARIVMGADGRAVGVERADGAVVRASNVIVAAEAPAARQLLTPVDGETAARLDLAGAGVTTLVYSLSRSFHRGRTIVLNSAPDGGRPRVDLVCQESNLTRPDVTGAHVLLVASVHGENTPPDVNALEGEMARVAGRWNPGYDWGRHAHLAEVVVHPFAQFRIPPGVRRTLPGCRTRVGNVLLAGDVTHHPSLEGAVASGNVAADIVSELIA